MQSEPPQSTGLEVVRSPNVNVLLLDDDPVNLHLRSAILRQHGYASVTATTVEEANQLLDNIDIAVLDVTEFFHAFHEGHGKFSSSDPSKNSK